MDRNDDFASYSGIQYQSIIDMRSTSGAFYCHRTRKSGSLARDEVSDVFEINPTRESASFDSQSVVRNT